MEAMEKKLKCDLCQDTYTDCTCLQCNHICCEDCLKQLEELVEECPACKQMQASGVAATVQVGNEEEPDTSKTSPSVPKVDSQTCSDHDGGKIELFCETCGDLICSQCTTTGQKHHSHKYELISSSLEKFREVIEPALEPLEEKLSAVNEAVGKLDTREEEIIKQQAAVEADIQDMIRQLHELLNTRKSELINELNQVAQSKLDVLVDQKEEIEAFKTQLGGCVEFVQDAEAQGEQALSRNAMIVMPTGFEPDTLLKPRAEADISFTASMDIASIHNYGKVHISREVSLSKCHVTGRGLEVGILGEASTVLLQGLDFEGDEEYISCDLVSVMTGTSVRGDITKTGYGVYEVTFKPILKGKHQLNIKFKDQHFAGSPFDVAIMLSVPETGTLISTISGIEEPHGMAVNRIGEVVIADGKRGVVSVFSPSGKRLQSFGASGCSDGLFESPHGVTVNSEGCILVADSHNHRIQCFTMDGQFLRAVGAAGSGPLKFTYPKNIAFNAYNDRIYISDDNCIQVLNSDLTYYCSFGHRTGKEQFNCVCGIACDNTGKVYIMNSKNAIEVFTAEGEFVRMIEIHHEEIRQPSTFSIDADDNKVYVLDETTSHVVTYTCAGERTASFQAGEQGKVRGLAVKTGVLYLCDVN